MPEEHVKSTQSVQPPRTRKRPKKPIPWDRDGVNGGDSSMSVLLDWLTTDGNYARWRGNTEHGMTKESLCSEIVGIMISKGIAHRDKKGVRQKINDLQSSYTLASNWKKTTGVGILATDEANGVKTVRDYIKTLCRYWDILDPIMASSSCTQPLHIQSSMSQVENPSQGTNQDGGVANEVGCDTLPIDLINKSPSGGRDPDPSEGEASCATTAKSSTRKHKNKSVKKRKTRSSSYQSGSSTSKRNHWRVKSWQIEDIFMKTMISKQRSEVIRLQIKANRAKVDFMKELREQGFSKEEVLKMVAAEFPPIKETQEDEYDSEESLSSSE